MKRLQRGILAFELADLAALAWWLLFRPNGLLSDTEMGITRGLGAAQVVVLGLLCGMSLRGKPAGWRAELQLLCFVACLSLGALWLCLSISWM